ncbi:hypothetical protein Tsubulata_047321 [Turnera subulata]|uniref:Uncharacterized protein n=1 Tax=Turnera subulata TaxID=218843 RepID=A0A9Q0FZQ2_9ROSI|nr:hypothetical protein Tsubulata_047321 [Turnera subulata]
MLWKNVVVPLRMAAGREQAWAALTRIGQARSGVVGSLEVGCYEFFCGCDAVQRCGFLKSTGGEGSYQGGSEDGADSFLTVTGGVGRQLVEGGVRGGARVQVEDQPVAFLRISHAKARTICYKPSSICQDNYHGLRRSFIPHIQIATHKSCVSEEDERSLKLSAKYENLNTTSHLCSSSTDLK